MEHAVKKKHPSLVLGLTGGIASGKSVVSGMLAELGAVIIDVDEVARELQEPGQPALEAIAEEFGRDILDDHGSLKRKTLGDIVFNDRHALERLNRIMFPRLVDAVEKRLDRLLEQPVGARGVEHPATLGGRASLHGEHTGRKVIVVDAAILFESGMHRLVDFVIAVHASDDVRIKRLMERNGYSYEEALARLEAQTASRDICARADFVVENSGPVEETRRQVLAVWRQLVGESPRRPAGEDR
ncbi:MAG TPA: dephospho-CoA kinase [Firmicutes bacterium]|nr:dephospho-CoA kinase [Bacillota bacterium]